MCDEMEEREVWDCCVPAAIRDLDIPQDRGMDDTGSFDSVFHSSDGAYHVAYRRRARNMKNKKTDEDEGFWAVFASFFDGVRSPDDVHPPPVFFELRDLPQAPTWSEKEIDHDWLPQAPSLAYDEYSISEES
jgi:hypothetical protein